MPKQACLFWLKTKSMSFLRKIRLKSIVDGDVKKHGFFMIAEMLLIILGITGALQLDNWNNTHNNTQAETLILEQLSVEFELVENSINTKLEELHAKDSLLFNLYKSCGTEITDYPKDDVVGWVAKGISQENLTMYQGVLEDAINTGSLTLIKNDSLRIHLYSWKTGVLYVQDHISITNEDISVFLRDIYNDISFRNYDNAYFPEIDLGDSEFEYDPNELFTDIYFENITGVLYFRNKILIKHIDNKLLVPLKSIRSLIDSELSERKL